MKKTIWKNPKQLLAITLLSYTSVSLAENYYLPSSSFKLDGENPHYGIIGDFNADGTDDLAVVFPIPDNVTGAITSTRINFLVGNHAGNLKLETSFPLPFNVLSMAAGDFNGDGNPDLAVAQDKANGISDPYCGTQQGTVIFFGFYDEIQPDLEFASCMLDTPPAELWTIDINADDQADLIVGNQLFLSNGDGSFSLKKIVPAGNKVIADINGDGYPDVFNDSEALCSDGNGELIFCPLPLNQAEVMTDNQGNIPFQSYKAVIQVAQQASADIDGDGSDDLVGAMVTSLDYPVLTSYRKCGWTTAIVNVYRPGAGRGRSRGGRSYSRRSRQIWRCSTTSYNRPGSTLVTTTSGVPIPEMSTIITNLIQADGSFEQVKGPEIVGYIRTLQVADVNEDGHMDILADIANVGNTKNNLGSLFSATDWKVFTGNGDGTFNLPEPTGLPLNAVIPGDFNGDGLTDFAAYNTPFDSEHLLSVAFHNPPSIPLTTTTDTIPPSVTITSPVNGETILGVIQLIANANDNTGVTDVVFQVNGSAIGQISASPYELTWDSSALVAGDYTLQAIATDAAGNISTTSINVTVGSGQTASPAPAPAPSPVATTTAQPTGDRLEFSGTITEVGTNYFVIDGNLNVSIGAASILKFEDGYGPIFKVGEPVEGKADEYSDGRYVLVKAQVG